MIIALLVITSVVYTLVFYPELVNGYWDTLVKAFDADREPTKFAQQKMLLSHFYSSPICGEGFGQMFYEPFPGRMRWGIQFELQYHLKLAQTGIIGFTLIMLSYWGTFFIVCIYLINVRILCFGLLLLDYSSFCYWMLPILFLVPLIGCYLYIFVGQR